MSPRDAHDGERAYPPASSFYIGWRIPPEILEPLLRPTPAPPRDEQPAPEAPQED